MKKTIFIFTIALLMIACSGGNKENKTEKESRIETQDEGLVSYTYKINGLQDSIIADSIWRIIFQVEGINKLVLSRDDSVAVFEVDAKLVSNELLEEEIVSRGGEILN